MDNINISLDDIVGLTPTPMPQLTEQSSILSQSDVITGPAGPQGPAGPAGKDGAAATISIGSTTTGAAGTNAQVQNSGTATDAVLDFTIPRGDTGTPATIEVGTTTTLPAGSDAVVQNSGTSSAAVLNFGIPKGDTGATGQAATITVGSVETVAPEYPATVNNSGTSSTVVLDFEIPQGQTGATGPAGADGRDGQDGADGQAATITVGTVTTGAAGSNVVVQNSGTATAAVLDFTIPRGDTGATGPAGADGQAATITVGTTTTLPAGSSATVNNSGSTSAAVLNFGIPKGDTGATGPQGESGVMISAYNSISSVSIPGTSTYTDILTVTVPENGKYLLFFNGDIVANSQVYIKLVKNTTDIDDSLRANAYIGRHDMTCMAVYSCNKNDIIHAQGYATANSQARRAVLTIVRLSA